MNLPVGSSLFGKANLAEFSRFQLREIRIGLDNDLGACREGTFEDCLFILVTTEERPPRRLSVLNPSEGSTTLHWA